MPRSPNRPSARARRNVRLAAVLGGLLTVGAVALFGGEATSGAVLACGGYPCPPPPTATATTPPPPPPPTIAPPTATNTKVPYPTKTPVPPTATVPPPPPPPTIAPPTATPTNTKVPYPTKTVVPPTATATTPPPPPPPTIAPPTATNTKVPYPTKTAVPPTATATTPPPPPPPPPPTATPVPEGCTPGYWKQDQHFDSWTTYTQTTTLESVFDVPNSLNRDNQTLLEALQGGGGPGVQGAATILLRASTAALLNSTSAGVDYQLTTAQVIAQVNTALASNDRQTMLTLAETLDRLNNAGCDLN